MTTLTTDLPSTLTLNHSVYTIPTNSTAKPYDKPFNIYIYMVVWLLFFLACVVGNGLVCATVYRNRKMRTPTNALLVNLAIADMLTAITTIFVIMDFVIQDLEAGSVTCKLQVYTLDICYGASMLSLVAISIERYYAVCRPTEFDKIKQQTKKMIVTIWTTSILLYVPMLWACDKRSSGKNRQVSCNCYSKWGSWYNYAIYGTLIVLVLYVFPFVAMLFSYIPVIKWLWGTGPTSSSQQQAGNTEQKKRVTKMLIVVVLLFFISWTPYNVLYMLKKFQVDFRHVYSYVWYLSLMMAFANSFYNPIVYCAMNRNFRKGFKDIFSCSKHLSKKARGRSIQSPDESVGSGDSKATLPSDIQLGDVQVITKYN